jgi:hypothetical protein
MTNKNMPKQKIQAIQTNRKIVKGNFANVFFHAFLILSIVVFLPFVLALDLVLFAFTRPTCPSCANVFGYLIDGSITSSIIVGGRSYIHTLANFISRRYTL